MLVGRRGIELEIACMDDRPERRGQGQRAGFDGAVREVNEFHVEGAYVERLAGMHLDQASAFGKAVLLEFGARQRQGERRAVNRRIHFVQQIGQGRRCGPRGRGSE